MLGAGALNFQAFAEVSFGFTPTPGIVMRTLLFGTLMGRIGRSLASLRVACLSILNALRA